MWQLQLLLLMFVVGPLNAKILDLWLKYPLNGTINYYFFNLTNPEEFLNEETEPNFEEKGPYQFSQENIRTNLVYNDNDTISFRPVRTWKHISGALDDEITIPNPIILTLTQKVRHFAIFTRFAINTAIQTLGERLIINKSIRELLFDGYDDKIQEITSQLFNNPEPKKFGLFYKKNGTDEFSDLINIAIAENTTFGKLYQINGNTTTDELLSIDDYFRTPLDRTNVTVFVPDFCTGLVFQYFDEEIVNGIKGYRYIIADTILDEKELLNISKCARETPFFISLPYYNDNESERNKTNQISSITIEPITGFTLKIEYRFQINIMVEKVSYIKILENIKKRYFFPIMWYEYQAEISEDLSNQIKSLINLSQEED